MDGEIKSRIVALLVMASAAAAALSFGCGGGSAGQSVVPFNNDAMSGGSAIGKSQHYTVYQTVGAGFSKRTQIEATAETAE